MWEYNICFTWDYMDADQVRYGFRGYSNCYARYWSSSLPATPIEEREVE